MKILFITFLIAAFTACSNGPKEVVEASYPDGSPKTVKVYSDKSKTEVIREIHYYPGKKLKLQGDYNEGNRNRIWVSYFENGNKWSQGKYINGKEDSTWTVWHPNGQVFYKGDFKMGERTGIWKFYDEAGNLDKEINYDEF